MKNYTKPSMTIAKFGSKEDIANGSVYGLEASFVGVEEGDTPVSAYKIMSLGANS